MMGLGSLGNGGSPSPSSNLSALAVPFTVDRSNPKPNSSPPLPVHFTEPPYASPFSQNWSYPRSSASRPPELFPSCNSEIDSMRITSLPSPNDYCYSGSELIDPPSTVWPTLSPSGGKIATDAFSYVAETKPYYPTYASSVLNDGTPLVALNNPGYDLLSTSGVINMNGSSSQAGYSQSMTGLDYTPHWSGFWNGLPDSKQGKRIDLEGTFCPEEINSVGSLAYPNYMNQEACNTESLSKSKENCTTDDKKCTNRLGRSNHAGSRCSRQLDDSSTSVHNLRFNHVEPLSKPIFGSGSVLPEYLQASPLESSAVSLNHQKPSITHWDCFHPINSNVNDCIPITKTFCSPIIRPPSSSSATSFSNIFTSKTVDICSVETVKSDTSYCLKGKEWQLPPGSGSKECLSVTSQLSCNVSPCTYVKPSLVKEEEQSSRLLTRSSSDDIFISRSEVQVPYINMPDDLFLNLGGTRAVNSTENSSESLDHHNPAVDSPCWRGAPSSQFISFGVSCGTTPQQNVKKLEAFNGFNLEEAQNPVIAIVDQPSDSIVFVNDVSSLSPKRPETDFIAKEDRSDGAAKSSSGSPQLCGNREIQFPNYLEKPQKMHELTSKLNPVFNLKDLNIEQPFIGEDNCTSERRLNQVSVTEGGMNTDRVIEDGFVTYHARENVSYSPSLGEHPAKLMKQYAKESTPKMNVQMLVNAIHNLSELLLFHCLSDAHALSEINNKAVEHVIGNLDACLSKKSANMTPAQDAMCQLPDNSYQNGESSDIHKSGSAGLSHMRNDAADNSWGQLEFKDEQSKNNVSGRKFEKLPDSVSFGDEPESPKDKKVIQAIKKILDEICHGEEESQSRALLYKNLWLESEAELCSISFRARFDRVKTEMEKLKSQKVEENAPAFEKHPSPEARGGSFSCTSVQDSPYSSTTGHVDDAEASVMARFHILNCRRNTLNPMNEEEQPPLMGVDNGFAAERSLMKFMESQSSDRMKIEMEKIKTYNVEENTPAIENHSSPDISPCPNLNHSSTNEAKGSSFPATSIQDPYSSATRHVDDVQASVMARFHILNRRRDTLNPMNVEEQPSPVAVDGGFAGEGNLLQFMESQSRDGSIDVALASNVQHHPDRNNENNSGSCGDYSAPESAAEFRVHIADDPVIQPHAKNRIQNQLYSGWFDNSSSEWEHVLKDEFACQN